VVVKAVPPGATVVGIPARVVEHAKGEAAAHGLRCVRRERRSRRSAQQACSRPWARGTEDIDGRLAGDPGALAELEKEKAESRTGASIASGTR
jgi:hypothetical protein